MSTIDLQPPRKIKRFMPTGTARFDSRTRLRLSITLPLSVMTDMQIAAALAGSVPDNSIPVMPPFVGSPDIQWSDGLRTAIVPSMRMVDGSPLRMYDAKSGSMLTVQLSDRMFEFGLEAPSTLHVLIARGNLPVSKTFGNSPLKFCFVLKPSNHAVWTTPVFIEGRSTSVQKRSKTQRGRAAAVPYLSPETESDRIVTAGMKAMDAIDVTDAKNPPNAKAKTEPPAARPLKRHCTSLSATPPSPAPLTPLPLPPLSPLAPPLPLPLTASSLRCCPLCLSPPFSRPLFLPDVLGSAASSNGECDVLKFLSDDALEL